MSSSVENGSNSATRMPSTFVRWLRRLCAPRLASYPSCSMTCCTRSTVAWATPYRPLTTFDTVATDTPAVRATSAIFTRCMQLHAVDHRGAAPVRVENVIDND